MPVARRTDPRTPLAPLLVAALVLAFASSSCSHTRDDAAARDTSAPVGVTTETVGGEGLEALVLPGRVQADEEATLAARAPGRVSALVAREGAHVRSGDVLVQLDSPEAVRALAAARSERTAAVAALAAAARQHTRIESLYVAHVVAAADREAAEAAHRSAEARLAAAEAGVAAREAETTLRAPFAGVVVRRRADPGTDVVPGTPLLDLRSDGANELTFAVPEAATAALAHATLEVQIGDGAWRNATLVRLDGMIDPATRSRLARVHADGALGAEPGAFAHLRVRAAHAAAVAKPSVATRAIVRRGALTGVYVVANDGARLRWIALGRENDGRVEVLAGLDAGERVALESAALHDGARVRVAR